MVFFLNYYIVQTQCRPQSGVGGSEALPCLDKTIFVLFLQLVVGIRHRSVVEVTADYGFQAAVTNTIYHVVHLLSTFFVGLLKMSVE